MITVHVDRRTWYRGKGRKESRLLRDDGQRCCVGFLGKTLGATDDDMLDEPELDRCGLAGDPVQNFADDHDGILIRAYNVNDDETISDADREARLIEIAKSMGVNFVFEN